MMSRVLCARLSVEVKAQSKRWPSLLQHGAGAVRLGHAFLGEADILPAGEAVEPVPLALAVADENEHVLPGGGLARCLRLLSSLYRVLSLKPLSHRCSEA